MVLRSVFYDILHKGQRSSAGEHLKEYISHQEACGNQVLLPKVNHRYIAIRKKSSNLVMIYSIKLKKVIRKFILTSEEL